ncbi:hypothetical protein V8F06_013044 [Rhypophila decipiens]
MEHDKLNERWARLPGSCLTLQRNLPRKQLTWVKLYRANFRCCELLAFLASLPTFMEEIWMDDVRLLDGTWEEVIEMLRKKKYPGRYGVKLEDCSGGELIHMTIPQGQTFFAYNDIMDRTFLEMYCVRMVKTNPLLAFRTGEWNEEEFSKELVDV